MKPELVWLLWAVALTFVQMLVAVGGATLQVGLPALAGNREENLEFGEFHGLGQVHRFTGSPVHGFAGSRVPAA